LYRSSSQLTEVDKVASKLHYTAKIVRSWENVKIAFTILWCV